MRIERHPHNYVFRKQFPNARAFRGWEGGVVYQAERDGRAYLIVDEGTMADFLSEEDSDLLDTLVKVIEFDNEADRESYITRELKGGVSME